MCVCVCVCVCLDADEEGDDKTTATVAELEREVVLFFMDTVLSGGSTGVFSSVLEPHGPVYPQSTFLLHQLRTLQDKPAEMSANEVMDRLEDLFKEGVKSLTHEIETLRGVNTVLFPAFFPSLVCSLDGS